ADLGGTPAASALRDAIGCRPALALSPRASALAERVRAVERGGRAGAIDARGQPGEVAPRAYDVVLREIRARARGRVAARSQLRVPVQQLLRECRSACRAC